MPVYDGNWGDSTYRLSYTFAHTAPTLALTFTSTQDSPPEDEGWGLDNVQVTLPNVGATALLTVTKTGTGTGTVSSLPTGIQCGTDCTQAYAVGTEVALVASPDEGQRFTGWSGACSGTGMCVVTMNAAKNVKATFVPTVGNQTIGAITLNPAHLVVGGTTQIAAKASSGLPVAFNVTTPGVCTLNGATLTGISAGICTITADQAGNADFHAAPQRVQSLNVFEPPQAGGTMTVDLSVYACADNRVVTSKTPAICSVGSIDGNLATIHLYTAGNCRLDVVCTASDGTEVRVEPKVPPIDRVIPPPMPTLPPQGNIGTPIEIPPAPEGLCAGAKLTTKSLTPTICSVSGTKVTLKSAGTCRISINRAATTSCNAAHDELTIEALQTGQTIGSMTFTPTTVYVGGTTRAKATSTSSLAVTFSSTTPAVCSVNKTTITGVAAGNCIVAANQAGNARYLPAPQITQSLTVLPTKADLVVASVLLTPTMPSTLATFNATITVKNTGKTASSQGYLEVWANEPTAQGCATTGDAWVEMGYIAPGTTKAFNVLLRSGVAGTKTLRAFADSWCETEELNEENNQITKGYTVR